MSVAVKLATRYVEMADGALLPFTGKTFIATLLLIIFWIKGKEGLVLAINWFIKLMLSWYVLSNLVVYT